MDRVVHLIDPCITSDMSDLLLRPFTRADLEVALFYMPPTKAPGTFFINVIGVLLVTLSVLLACAYLMRMKQGKRVAMALKLDMAKAYDHVECSFLEAMMLWLVLWHGTPFGLIIPHQGLRQGCPLSPYLFLTCAEGFSGLLRHAEFEGLLRGICVGHSSPRISHLLFTDDSLLFLEMSEYVCLTLKEIFCIYEEASADALGIPVVACNERYLGLPTRRVLGAGSSFCYVRDYQQAQASIYAGLSSIPMLKQFASKGCLPKIRLCCLSCPCKAWWSQEACSKGYRIWEAHKPRCDKLKFQRSLRSVAEERADRKLDGLRVLNSYWINENQLALQSCSQAQGASSADFGWEEVQGIAWKGSPIPQGKTISQVNLEEKHHPLPSSLSFVGADIFVSNRSAPRGKEDYLF
ncbi:unnamed protein product [Prunus armeniaca]|uniref:Ribosomal protein L15 n=1 Tax=Prunus armeniaca TaxID=36596 RepID=A0A6J5VBN2_PRUAR|nr:unnamed protein product [Prunus armeniaca]